MRSASRYSNAAAGARGDVSDDLGELQRRFTATLAKTQWLAPSALQRYQARLLSELLWHAAVQVPFYRDGRLAPVVRSDGIDLSGWQAVPILTRQQARTAGMALRADRVPEMSGPASAVSTSGSTGSPFVFLRSGAASFASQCCGERHFGWLGVPEMAPVAVMRSASNRPQPAPGDAPAADVDDAVPGSGLRQRPRFDTGSREVAPLTWLAGTGARHLVTYPTFARGLARDIRSGRAPPLPLDLVLTFGEVLSEETRTEIAAAFGARVADRYAAEETGMLAGECPAGSRHVQSEINLVEVLDDAGRPVPPGSEGQVVVTSFYNYAMPLIRYAIGDRAVLARTPCPCGRHLPVLQRIAGRARDLFRLADGRSVWPFVPFAEMRRFIDMRQMQVVQVAPDRIALHYVPEGAGQVDRDGAAALVRRHLGAQLAVDFVAREEIPRLPGGKYLDYVSLVASG